MPEDVKDEFGYAISEAQAGRIASYAKPMKGNLREVTEVVSDDDGKTYRAMYTTKLAGRVYVLDAFAKKSKTGRATPKPDIQRIEQRLKDAKQHYRDNPP
jgi:phage-related protein